MASTTSPGALRLGTWPVALRNHQRAAGNSAMHVVADGARRDRVLPALQNKSRHGHARQDPARLSERKVTRANALAIAGSVRQKLAVNSSLKAGRSGFPMTNGAMFADQPMWFLSRKSSNSAIASAVKPPV